MGRLLGITIKRAIPCRCLDGHVKEPYEMSIAWEPDRRFNFFNPPAYLCAITYMTEISLNVTLNNHIHSLTLYNGAPLVAFYDTLGIRRTYSRLEPPASSRGAFKSILHSSRTSVYNFLLEKKEEIGHSPKRKAPTPQEKSKNQHDYTKTPKTSIT